jgi:hypothetical protein
VETWNVRETDNLIRDLAEYVKRANGAFLRRSAEWRKPHPAQRRWIEVSWSELARAKRCCT